MRAIFLSCLLFSTSFAISKKSAEYTYLMSEESSPDTLKAYEDKIKAQMKRMNESLEKSDKYAQEELNPSLKKIIGKNHDEVLEVDSEADQEDANMLATKSQLKTKMSKKVRQKLGETVGSHKKHHHKHSSKKHHHKK